jgi:hypothetical protein
MKRKASFVSLCIIVRQMDRLEIKNEARTRLLFRIDDFSLTVNNCDASLMIAIVTAGQLQIIVHHA